MSYKAVIAIEFKNKSDLMKKLNSVVWKLESKRTLTDNESDPLADVTVVIQKLDKKIKKKI